MTVQERVRYGVLGCADIAERKTVPAILSSRRACLTAVASRDVGRAKQFTERFGGAPLGSYAELLSRDDVDAVYIPLPARLHAEWIERALAAGKHVLVEKPLTDELATTERLTRMARSANLVLLENYMFVFHAQHEYVEKLIADGAIGEIKGFTSGFTFPPKPDGDIRRQPGVGGGAFTDFGGYPVRAALHFLGNSLTPVGAVFRESSDEGVVISGSILLTTESGIPASLTFGMEHSYRNDYQISGSTGRIDLQRVFTPPDTHEPVVRITRQGRREELTLPPDQQFRNVIDAFNSAVIDGGDVAPRTADSLQQARIIDQIRRVATVIRV